MRRKGSMTCFAAMTIMLVGAFLFALLEATRSVEMHKVATVNSYVATESVFAGYVPSLWEEYHLLALPLCDDTGASPRITTKMQQYSKENLAGKSGLVQNLLAMTPEDSQLVEYQLLTDTHVFPKAAASYMQNNLAFESVDTLINYTQGTKELLSKGDSGTTAVEKALEALANKNSDSTPTEHAATPGTTSNTSAPTASTSTQGDSPLTLFEETKSKGILELVLQDTSKVSTQAISMDDLVSKRTLAQGNSTEQVSLSLTDTLLFETYLGKYLSSYPNQSETRALSYEKEYLVAGKSSDVENLRAVVDRILLAREAGNLMYLLSDQEKCAEAEAMATLLAGATANPVIIEAVKWGILASWAYFESILDLRTLLQGKKIPFVKDASTWTSDLSGLGQIADGYLTAKEVETGISYQEYLAVLMLLDGQEKAGNRALDLMEQTVRKQSGWSSFRMDQALVSGKFSYSYSYPSVFLGMDSITRGKKETYHITNQLSYSYLGQE